MGPRTALILLSPRCPAAAPPVRLGFSQFHDELGVSTSGPASVDAGVKTCRCAQVLVAQQLTHELVGARIAVEGDFGGQVAELMRIIFTPRCLRTVFSMATFIAPWVFGLPVKEKNTASGRLPITQGGELVPIDLQAFGEDRRDFELEGTSFLVRRPRV